MVTKNRWCALIQININQKNLQRMKYERDGEGDRVNGSERARGRASGVAGETGEGS